MHTGTSHPIFQVADPRSIGEEDTPQPVRTGFAGQDFFWIALAGSLAAFVLLVFKPNRARLRETEIEKTLLNAEISQLDRQASRLRAWERSLSSGDADAWSHLARERLGWLKPGEQLLVGTSREDASASPGSARRQGEAPARR
jgi:hypothetical protein